jgi:hypothetical protein
MRSLRRGTAGRAFATTPLVSTLVFRGSMLAAGTASPQSDGSSQLILRPPIDLALERNFAVIEAGREERRLQGAAFGLLRVLLAERSLAESKQPGLAICVELCADVIEMNRLLGKES